MRHGYQLGLGFYSPYIMTVTVLVIALIIYLASKHKSSPPNEYFIKVLDILKGKYAEGFIAYDDYVKRKSIIEDESADTSTRENLLKGVNNYYEK